MKISRFIFLVLILGVLLILGAMQLLPVKEFVINKGVDLIAYKMGQHLEVDDVDLLLPFEIKITRPRLLTLEGKDCFEASSILIRINPYSIFSREFHIHSLTVEDPVFHRTEGTQPLALEDVISLIPIHTVTVNHLKLIRYEIPTDWQDFKGLYTIDAKIEYNPDEGFAYVSAKATKSDNPIDAISGSLILFAEEDNGSLVFEVSKKKGIFRGLFGNVSGQVSGTLSGSFSDWGQFFQNTSHQESWALKGDASATWNFFDKKGALSTQLELGEGILFKLNELTLKTPDISLQSSLTMDSTGAFDGSFITLDVNDIGNILPLDVKSEGSLTVHSQLKGTLDLINGEAHVFSNRLHLFGKQIENVQGNINFSTHEKALFGNAELELDNQGKHYSSTFQFHTDFLTEASFNDIAIAIPWGNVKGDIAWQHSNGITASVIGRINDRLIDIVFDPNSLFEVKMTHLDDFIVIKGRVETQSGSFFFDIDELKGNFQKEAFFLETPFSLSTDFSSAKMTPINLSLGKGFITAKAQMQDHFWHLSLNFKKLPCTLLPFEQILTQKLYGDVDGEALFYGTVEHLEGTLHLDIQNIEDMTKNFPALKLSIGATFQNQQMECHGNVTGIGDIPLSFECSLPVLLSLKTPYIAVDNDAPLSAHLYAEGSFTPLFELFASDAAFLAADGKIHVQAFGTLNDPKLEGSFKLRNGQIELYDVGTLITDIQADIKASGTSLELTRLSGSDGANGQITGTGSLVFSKKDGFPFCFDISIQEAKPLQIDLFKGSASGLLSWHGTIHQSLLEGNLEIHEGELKLPKKIPETSISYPVQYINPDLNTRKPTEIITEKKQEIPIELKIQLKTHEELLITDEDLRSSWKGKINLQGNIQKPQIIGEIKLDSGDYILNGKRFVLSQGRVTFNGDIQKSNLYVSLSREIGGYDVEIILKGLLKDPNILLQSHPSLPKQQLLSLILFGRTSSDISELQEQQLEQSLSHLTSSSSKKEGTLSKLQKSLGIDHIDFSRSNDTSSEVRIRLSKYISRGICLSVYRDVGEDVNAVALEAELQKNIKAQVEAQDNAQGQVSIFWKKNY